MDAIGTVPSRPPGGLWGNLQPSFFQTHPMPILYLSDAELEAVRWAVGKLASDDHEDCEGRGAAIVASLHTLIDAARVGSPSRRAAVAPAPSEGCRPRFAFVFTGRWSGRLHLVEDMDSQTVLVRHQASGYCARVQRAFCEFVQ